MMEFADDVTALVVTVKVALVAPAATVTLAETCAAVVLPLLNVTTAPPLGAALFSVTVPCELLPPTRLVGFNASALTPTPPTITAPPTVLVGSDAANFLIRKLLKLALVFPSP